MNSFELTLPLLDREFHAIRENCMSNKSLGESQPTEGSAIDDISESEILSLVTSLHKYSKDSWTSREEHLWIRHLKMLRDEELAALKLRGLDGAKAERLVEWVWVSRNPASSVLIVDRCPSESSSSFVPAIRVFRNGGWVVHPHVFEYLKSHPMLAIPDGGESAKSDGRPLILQAIDKLEEKLDQGYIGLGYVCPGMPEDAGQDRRIVDCADAVHQLRVLLDTKYLKRTDEDLEWLEAAKNRERFWRLLDAAFLFGEFVEHRRLLDELGADGAMLQRITMPPGKGAKIERAVVRMIEEFALERNLLPKAEKLLKWLGGVKPLERGKPLQVNHPLWTDEMKPITWSQFQDRVKKAKQKMKRSGGRADGSNTA